MVSNIVFTHDRKMGSVLIGNPTRCATGQASVGTTILPCHLRQSQHRGGGARVFGNHTHIPGEWPVVKSPGEVGRVIGGTREEERLAREVGRLQWT